MKLWICVFFNVVTTLIAYTITDSIGWSIMDGIAFPIAWIKWFIYHDVSVSIIKETFRWFFR